MFSKLCVEFPVHFEIVNEERMLLYRLETIFCFLARLACSGITYFETTYHYLHVCCLFPLRS
jgi:hypothetical protein